MKAAQLTAYGDLSNVVVTDVPTPEPGPGQVLIEVHAASLNPLDTYLRLGYVADQMPLALPSTLGADAAGVVVALGQGATRFAVGDRVYGVPFTLAGGSGAFAEFAVAPEANLDTIPEGLTYEQAASLPVVGATAVDGVLTRLGAGPGMRLLITGGAGAVGALAVQAAASRGAHVVATARGAGVDLARSAGASEVIDTGAEGGAGSWTADVEPVDAVFDTAGGPDLEALLARVRRGGTAITIAGAGSAEAAEAAGVQLVQQQTDMVAALPVLSRLVADGTLTPPAVRTYPLQDVAAAFADRESGSWKGKVVISIR